MQLVVFVFNSWVLSMRSTHSTYAFWRPGHGSWLVSDNYTIHRGHSATKHLMESHGNKEQQSLTAGDFAPALNDKDNDDRDSSPLKGYPLASD